MKHAIAAAALVLAVAFPSQYALWKIGELDEITERIIYAESRWVTNAYNGSEGSSGLMGITPVALDEFNLWTGKHYRHSEMTNPVKNREVGEYVFKKLLFGYRCKYNIVQAVAAYNCGLYNVWQGIYPEEYCKSVIPWYWAKYCLQFPVVKRWRDTNSGSWLVRLSDTNGNAPPIGL